MKKIIIFIVLAIAVAGGAYYWYQQEIAEELPEGLASSNGRLELERFDIASLYAGRVQEVFVDEGDNIERNQVLVKLSSEQTDSKVKAAEAAEQRAREQVEQAKAGREQAEKAVERAKSEIEAREEQLKVAKLDYDNARKMRGERLISNSELEKRDASYNSAIAAVEAARAAYAEAQASVDSVEAKIDEARAGVEQAQAQQESAEAMDDDMAIRSPKSGRVEYRIAEPGSVIAAGNKVISILDTEDIHMNIFLPNGEMSPLVIGDEARIVLDNIDMVWPAEITFIASEAEFTPKSVETKNEREKLMFKVRLKIPPEVAKEHKGLLKGGMTGIGYVKTGSNVEWPDDLNVELTQKSDNESK